MQIQLQSWFFCQSSIHYAQKKKMISNSSLQKFNFQDPYVWIMIIYRKYTMVWTRLLWRRKKYIKKEYQESSAQQNDKHFSKKKKKTHSSYFLWIESKETTQIQKTNEENLQGTTPEQCLITMNFLYVKKKKHGSSSP